jgi:hypothetical protein
MKKQVRIRVAGAFALLAGLCCWTWQLPAQPPPQRDGQRGNQAPPLASKDGLSINKPGAVHGYTLMAPMNSTSTYLVDMDGKIVNEWKSEFTPALSAYLLPDGHLLRPGAERGFGPGAGGRIQKFNWDGELVWDYSVPSEHYRPHHDICALPNGNVLVIAHDPKTRDEAIAAGRKPDSVRDEFQPDAILEIKPTGKTTGEIVWKWHVWDHLIQDLDKSKPNYGDVSEHPELVDVNYGADTIGAMLANPQQFAQLRALGYVGGGAAPPADGAKGGKDTPSDAKVDRKDANKDGKDGKDRKSDGKKDDAGDDGPGRGDRRGGGPRGPGGGDWNHINCVAHNPELDQIMLSIHEFSEVWIIDHGTTTEEAASHKGGKRGKGGDLLYRWGNPQAYRNGTNADQRLFSQHCAHWIPAGLPGGGNMLVFNNGNRRPDGNYSTVDEVELPLNKDGLYQREEFVAFGPERAKWSYSASPVKESFFSGLISGAQRLANGNTYICSGNQAIMFEVTPEKEIVWMFKYPGGGVFGPGGGMRPGELANDFVRGMLDTTEAQNKSLDKLQSVVDAKLTKLLNEEQRKKLAEPFDVFAGPGGPGGRGPGQGPAGPNASGPNGPGPGGPAIPSPPRPGEVLPAALVEAMKLSDSQKEQLAALQKDVDAEIEKILTDEQKERVKDVQNGRFDRLGPGGGRGGRGRGPGGPGRDGIAGRGPGGRRGGPGGPGRGPGGRGGGPGGLFRSYRYPADYPAFAGKTLTPGKDLEEVAKAALGPRGERSGDSRAEQSSGKDNAKDSTDTTKSE